MQINYPKISFNIRKNHIFRAYLATPILVIYCSSAILLPLSYEEPMHQDPLQLTASLLVQLLNDSSYQKVFNGQSYLFSSLDLLSSLFIS